METRRKTMIMTGAAQGFGPDVAKFLTTLSPMREMPDVADSVDAVVYLAEARHLAGEVLHVDAGAPQREVVARA
jgi:nucleoside-diphosphate-sugar epimerase